MMAKELCKKYQEMMNLNSWDIDFIITDELTKDDSTLGTSDFIYGRQAGTIHIAEWLLDHPEQFRHVVIHELAHAHAHRIYETLVEIISHLSQEAQSMILCSVKLEIERAVDAISVAIGNALDKRG